MARTPHPGERDAITEKDGEHYEENDVQHGFLSLGDTSIINHLSLHLQPHIPIPLSFSLSLTVPPLPTPSPALHFYPTSAPHPPAQPHYLKPPFPLCLPPLFSLPIALTSVTRDKATLFSPLPSPPNSPNKLFPPKPTLPLIKPYAPLFSLLLSSISYSSTISQSIFPISTTSVFPTPSSHLFPKVLR